jgi:multiple sugar transport system permease protein
MEDPHWTKPAILLILLWGAGGGMVIWLAGLKNIPAEMYEAAKIDGAGPWQQFWKITIPFLTPYIFFNLVMGIISYLQIFTRAYVITGLNSPNDSLLFYVYYLFNNAFMYFKMGYASAMAWILFLVILALTAINLRLSKKWVYYQEGP